MNEAEATWTEVALTSEFQDSDRKRIDLGGMKKIGLFKVEGQYYAVNAFCTHAQVEIVEGDLDGFELMCPLHGACFDIRDGEVLAPPAFRPLQTYPTKVEQDKILLQV